MATDHLRNMESATRPMIALGLAATLPVLGIFAPFIVAGFFLFILFVALRWTWDAAMLPFTANDEVLADVLLARFGANGAIWGAVALLVVAYLAIGGWGWFQRGWPAFNLRLMGCLLLGYAAIVGVAGAVNGTHFPSQVAYAWSNPTKNATLAWNCQASVSEGRGFTRGRYDMDACRSYVDAASMRNACREVMRRMAPLTGTQLVCTTHIREMTKHEWPVEGYEYQEWERSFRVPVRHLPLATPALMPGLLAKQGLTPLAP